MKRFLIFCMVTTMAASSALTADSTLSAEECAAGWKLLFDGKSLAGWRGFKKKAPPSQGWVVENGILKKVGGVQGGDIITEEKFSNFELRWEWRIPARSNNGIKYFIDEQRSSPIGHEYQMIDDILAKTPKHKTGSFYDVLPPTANEATKIGEWNSSAVLVRGNNVEHWLNGTKILQYELGSEPVKKAVAASKFKDVAGFGMKLKGHILLTDHKDEAWFRDIKIRPFP